jgi:hypothetical protein
MLNRIIAKLKKIKHNSKLALDFWRWRIDNWITYRLNSLIRNQIKQPLSIPIIIISFNQMFYLKKLIDFLLKSKFTNIIIVDNKSTYPPLLAYFNDIETNDQITIHRLTENKGHLVFWEDKTLFQKYSKGYYVVTDADIVPIENIPINFITQFRKLLDKYNDITKVGFSLFLEDIPDSNPNKGNIINWEQQFWSKKENNFFKASIDTTFALYRPNYNRNTKDFLKGIRTDKPFTARHGGWYVNPNELTEEQKYYIQTASSSSSWLTDEKGELKNKFFKNYYKK